MRLLIKIIGVLLVVIVVAAAALYAVSANKLGKRYTVPDASFVAQASTEAHARGEYLSYMLGCHDCHGENLGGKLMGDAPPFSVHAPNLTPGEGGLGGRYTGADWSRAVRNGIGHDGRALFIMPASAYRHLSDEDMAALAAYLDRLPAVDGEHPGVTFKPLGRALVAAGALKPELVREPISISTAPAAGPNAAYGAYLASITCQHCHGPDLTGGPNPDPGGIPVPSLRPAAQWTQAQFAQAVREGVIPDGRQLSPEQMPWVAFSRLTDQDVTALYNYVRELANLPADASAPDTAWADTTATM